jgi:hypothetical protein
MWIEYLRDRNTHHLDQQYMLGPSLLVAPVFVPLGDTLEYYLPKGTWTSLWDLTVRADGPQWIEEEIALDDIPVWIRPGSIVLLGPDNTGRPDYHLAKSLEVLICEIAIGERLSVEVPTGKGREIAGEITIYRSDIQLEIGFNGSIEVDTLVIAIKDFKARAPDGDTENGVIRIKPSVGDKGVVLQADV